MEGPASPPRSRSRALLRIIGAVVTLPWRLARLVIRLVLAPVRGVRRLRARRARKRAEKRERREAKRLASMEPWERREVERARRLRAD